MILLRVPRVVSCLLFAALYAIVPRVAEAQWGCVSEPRARFTVRPAPPGVLRGRTVSAASGAPLELVSITLQPGPYTVHTDRHGLFELSGVPSGTFELRVRRIGFEPGRDSVTLGAHGLDLEISLDPAFRESFCTVAGSPLALRTTLKQSPFLVPLPRAKPPTSRPMPSDRVSIRIRGSTAPHLNRAVVVDGAIRMTADGSRTPADSAFLSAVRSCIATVETMGAEEAMVRFGSDARYGAVILTTVPSWNGRSC